MRETTAAPGARLLRTQHFAQHAVDAEAHHQAVLEGLDVDVRGVLAYRLGEQRVDQADDRRVVLALHQVGGLGQLVSELLQVQALIDVSRHRARVLAAAFVELLQQGLEALDSDLFQRQRGAEEAPQFQQRLRLDLRPTDDSRFAIGQPQHGDTMLARKTERKAGQWDHRLIGAGKGRHSPLSAGMRGMGCVGRSSART
jgi:hypothetical protein